MTLLEFALAYFTGIPWFHWLLPLSLLIFVINYKNANTDEDAREYAFTFWGSCTSMFIFTYILYLYTPITGPMVGMLMFFYSSFLAILDYQWVERSWSAFLVHMVINLSSSYIIHVILMLHGQMFYPMLYSILIALHGRYNINWVAKFFLGTRRYILEFFRWTGFDKRFKAVIGKSRWALFKYYFIRNFDWVLFSLVAGGVYYQCKRKSGKKTDFEAVVAQVDNDGISWYNCFRIFGIAIKVGSIVAGLAELGTHLLPRDVAFTSLLGDLFKFVSELFDDGKKNPSGVAKLREVNELDLKPDVKYITRQRDGEPMRYFVIGSDEPEEELGADMDELKGFMKKLRKNFNKLLTIIYRHKVRLTLVALGSILGVLCYLYVHKPHLFRKISLFANSYEAKGKTKKGRGAMKVNNPKKKKPFILYEDEAIAAMFIDGKEVNVSEYFSTELRPGRYEIWRSYPAESGYTIKSEVFEVTENQIDAGYEALDENRSNQDCYNSLFFRVRGDVSITPQQFVLVDSHGSADVLRAYPDVPSEMNEKFGIHEAVLPSSPLFKTDQIKQFVVELLDEDKNFIQGATMTNKGMICNKHSIDRVRFIRKGDKIWELPLKDGKVEYDPIPLNNSDIIRVPCTNAMDGFSRAKGQIFKDPEVGQKVTIVRPDGRISVGQILTITTLANGDHETTYSLSTEEGDCGLPVINQNGQIVAIHFAKADSHANRGAPCNEKFKQFFKRAAPALPVKN